MLNEIKKSFSRLVNRLHSVKTTPTVWILIVINTTERNWNLMTVEIDTYLRHKETNMDNQLEQYYLDKNNFTDEQIEEEREKKYWYYRGKLNDFRTLFEKEIDDVQFEVMFEKLMKG